VVDESKRAAIADAMRRINEAWLEGRVADMAPIIHPEIVLALPEFVDRARGRETFLAGFQDFCENATVHEFRDDDQQIDVVGDTGVVTIRWAMVYERGGARYRATGRDIWVFELNAGEWLAVWRTMLDVEETAA
jgi:hypothetical protein